MALVPASSHGGLSTPVEVDAAVEGGLVIDQGAAAASTAVLAVNDALGNNVFSATPAGVVTIFSDGARQEATLNMSDNTSGNPGVVTLDTYTGLLMNIEASGQTLVRLSPRTGHTGRQLVALNAGGVTELLAISVGGYLLIKTHAAPADAELAAGECALWFDQTDGVGNTKLMLKGKSADGTVKAATILLA